MSIKAKRGFWLGVREVLFIALTFVMMLPIYYLVITTFKTLRRDQPPPGPACRVAF